MADLITRIRGWIGLGDEKDAERAAADSLKRAQEHEVRLLRLDAGLPVDRRRLVEPINPKRRADDPR